MTVGSFLPTHRTEPIHLQTHAIDDLRFIRNMMERSTSFTAVPGWGMIAMGITALIATGMASQSTQTEYWLEWWITEAILASAIGFLTMWRKAKQASIALFSGAGSRFLLNLFLPILVAVPFTLVLNHNQMISVLPSLWLSLYGIGVVTGGAFSVRTIPVMGFCFIATGIISLFFSPLWGNSFLAFGFGGLHILFGGIIAWRHGG